MWKDVGFVDSDVVWAVVEILDDGPGVRRGGNGVGDGDGWKSESEVAKTAAQDCEVVVVEEDGMRVSSAAFASWRAFRSFVRQHRLCL